MLQAGDSHPPPKKKPPSTAFVVLHLMLTSPTQVTPRATTTAQAASAHPLDAAQLLHLTSTLTLTLAFTLCLYLNPNPNLCRPCATFF